MLRANANHQLPPPLDPPILAALHGYDDISQCYAVIYNRNVKLTTPLPKPLLSMLLKFTLKFSLKSKTVTVNMVWQTQKLG